jgi:hypothetical protein
MTSLGASDNATLRRLWADLEKVGGQYENGLISLQDLLRQHHDQAAKRLADWLQAEREEAGQ